MAERWQPAALDFRGHRPDGAARRARPVARPIGNAANQAIETLNCRTTPYIVARYEQELRGVAEYYRPASNLREFGRLKWGNETSQTTPLAARRQNNVRQVYPRYRTTIATGRGPRVALQAPMAREGMPPLVAACGRTDFVRRINKALNDSPTSVRNGRHEIVERLLADTSKRYGSQEKVQIHQVRALKDLRRPG